MKRIALLATAAFSLTAISAPAAADTLAVTGTIAPFCGVSLVNVSSGTASVAMAGTQQIGNLRLACNTTKSTMVTKVLNGDLLDGTTRINYAFELRSPDPIFGIAETDTDPGNPAKMTFSRSKTGHSIALSNGLALELWINMNVAGEAQAVGSSPVLAANLAPAGTYSETFTFTASAV